MRAIEELAHRDRRRTVLADLPEVSQVFRRKRVFQKEHLKLLGFLAELHGQVRRQSLVHIMQQFDFIAQFLAANLQQLQRAAEISSRLEERLIVQRL